MFYMIIMGILSLCVAIFAVQNAVSVEVSFLFWHFSMSLALIISLDYHWLPSHWPCPVRSHCP